MSYILTVLQTTFYQLFVLFGPLLVLAFLMNYIARLNEMLSYKAMGRNVYLYAFGWLGTAIHELGHAFFALIFGHKIDEIQLFSPDSKNVTLGYVKHSYNRKSFYQQFGNFFIGIGPILFGSIMLFLITYFMFKVNMVDVSKVRITSDTLTSLTSLKEMAANTWQSTLSYAHIVFKGEHTSWWKIILLIYFLYSIGSSITLSAADVSSSSIGFLYFIGFLLVFNLLTLWIGNFASVVFEKISLLVSGFYFLICLSMIANLAFIVVLGIVVAIKSR